MNEDEKPKTKPGETEFSQQVGEMAARKLKAQRHVTKTIWTGLGMMGLVGWSVAMPQVDVSGEGVTLWVFSIVGQIVCPSAGNADFVPIHRRSLGRGASYR